MFIALEIFIPKPIQLHQKSINRSMAITKQSDEKKKKKEIYLSKQRAIAAITGKRVCSLSPALGHTPHRCRHYADYLLSRIQNAERQTNTVQLGPIGSLFMLCYIFLHFCFVFCYVFFILFFFILLLLTFSNHNTIRICLNYCLWFERQKKNRNVSAASISQPRTEQRLPIIQFHELSELMISNSIKNETRRWKLNKRNKSLSKKN